MLIWIRTVTVKETYSYVQYEKELRHLQQEIQETKVKWLSLTTPKRLELISKVLDLRSTDPSQILLYEPSTTEKP
jgi:orotate phosphoribosyltransferase-like protein